MHRRTLVGLAMIALCVPVPAAVEAKPAPPTTPAWVRSWDGTTLTAHEWGTFTSVQGSDAVVLDGLTHEARDLPSFVYDLRDRANVTGVSPKMETPVVYFYAPSERRVSCAVKFPRGVITQWYPAAFRVNHVEPSINGMPTPPRGQAIDDLRDGYITWGKWRDLRVLGRGATHAFPPVAKDDPWRFCRQVDANPLRVCNLNARRAGAPAAPDSRVAHEDERCLFYRGLGNFELPLTGRITRDAVSDTRYEADLDLRATGEVLEHVFIVHVHGDRAGFAQMPRLTTWSDRLTIELRDKATTNAQLVEAMARRLTRTGLFTDEAYAMARTWQHGWFQEAGTRVLYVLPRGFVDQELPLRVKTIAPRKARGDTWKIVRTFVGRTELLSPRAEVALLGTVRDLATGTAAQQADAEATLAAWGRFAAPYLQRVLALTADPAVRARVAGRLRAMEVLR